MGNTFKAGNAAGASNLPSEADWPWVWAIRDPEQLDWKRGLEDKPEVLERISKQQSPLPVPLDVFTAQDDKSSAPNGSSDPYIETLAMRATSFLWLGDAACARHASRLRRYVCIGRNMCENVRITVAFVSRTLFT